jgi:hypothetical protein
LPSKTCSVMLSNPQKYPEITKHPQKPPVSGIGL